MASSRTHKHIKHTGPCVGRNPGIQIGVGTYPSDAKSLPLNTVPKTGLADLLRGWMQGRTGTIQERRFTTKDLAVYLQAHDDERAKMRDALKDFIRRGEVKVIIYKKYKRRQLLYVPDHAKELKGIINKKVFKAMYVSGTFSITDIKRLTAIKDRNYLDKIARELKREGHLQAVSRRNLNGGGRETVWHIADRDKFNLEKLR